jgi:hypothetical protein
LPPSPPHQKKPPTVFFAGSNRRRESNPRLRRLSITTSATSQPLGWNQRNTKAVAFCLRQLTHSAPPPSARISLRHLTTTIVPLRAINYAARKALTYRALSFRNVCSQPFICCNFSLSLDLYESFSAISN